MHKRGSNVDYETVKGFGEEWRKFDQSAVSAQELQSLFDAYFSIFPWDSLPRDAEGFDLGCGSGRWARLVAPRVGRLHCIDPSNALEVARKNLAAIQNCHFHSAVVDAMPIADSSMDFGYSIGVLHHVPDTRSGMEACVKKLKVGAPFLIYLYYAFDNRPWWFRAVWRVSDAWRSVISRFPYRLKYFTSQCLAFAVYLPLARVALALEKAGLSVDNFPLSAYRRRSLYTMRTDALDRFGTRLEQRFSRRMIAAMMEQAGLDRVAFSEAQPFWCAIGYRRQLDITEAVPTHHQERSPESKQ